MNRKRVLMALTAASMNSETCKTMCPVGKRCQNGETNEFCEIELANWVEGDADPEPADFEIEDGK